MKKPLIGITAANIFSQPMYSQRTTYPMAVEANGGLPVLLPCMPSVDNIKRIVEAMDGFILPGGADIDPRFYDEERQEFCGKSCVTDDLYDATLIAEAIYRGKPVLAICRGMQTLNVVYGGTLYQDIPQQYGKEIFHSMLPDNVENYHDTFIDADSRLSAVLGTKIRTNTSHHQAVKDLAPGYRVIARAADGTVEAIENYNDKVICVQWHPERMQDVAEMRDLFKYFIDMCKE